MKKSTKRLTAILVLLAMIATLVPVSVLAKTQKNKHYDTYTVIGDSIASAYGLTEDGNYKSPEAFQFRHGKVVDGSYVDLVSKAIGAKHVYNEAREGYTAAWVTRMISPEFDAYCSQPEHYLDRFFSELCVALPKMSDPLDIEEQKKTIVDHIKKSDCITINLGSNDTGLYGIMAPLFKLQYYTYGMAAQPAATAVKNQFNAIKTPDQFWKMVGGIKDLDTEYEEGFQRFETWYDFLIKRIRELNPKADIYVLGMTNCFRDDDPQDNALRKQLADKNDNSVRRFREYATKKSAYRNEITYVNVYDTESLNADEFGSIPYLSFFLTHVHPTYAGHEYMAKQILTAMNGGRPDARINDASYRTMQKKNGQWGVYNSHGTLYDSFTGLGVKNGKYYYVKDGKYQPNFTGTIKVPTGTFQIKQGQMTKRLAYGTSEFVN